MLSISSLILKKAKAVHQGLGGEDPTIQGPNTAANDQTVPKLRTQLQNLRKANEDLETRNQKGTTELENLKAELAKLKTGSQQSSNEEKEKQAKEIELLRKKLHKSEAMIEGLINDNKFMELEMKEFRQKSHSLAERAGTLQQVIYQKERVFAEKNAQILVLEKQIMKLTIQLKEAKTNESKPEA